MITNKSAYSAVAALLLGGAWAYAQQPDISIVSDRNSASLEKLSNNGEWAVGYGKSSDEISYSYPKLYDVKNKVSTNLFKNGEENTIMAMMACDVTDDGSMVAGQYDDKPAIWYAATAEWVQLPYNNSRVYSTGKVSSITPDGRYAVGTVSTSNLTAETLVMWNLTGDEAVDITPDNLPKPISMYGDLDDYQQIRACDISDDGSKFIGQVGFSYAGYNWTFIYDMPSKTWEGIGVTVEEVDDTHYAFTLTGTGYFDTEGGKFRPGSNEVAGYAWLDSDVDGIYVYNMDTKEITIVEDSASKLFGGVDRYGLIYASNPAANPVRDWEVKVGKYWYDFKVIARQLWGIDWQNDVLQDEYGYSGTFCGVSDDGLVLLANEYTNSPYDSYVIQIDQPLVDLCPNVNILDNYVVSPVSNAAFAILREVKVMFDRNIELMDDMQNAVTCSDGKDDNYTSTSVSIDPGDSRVLNIIFRNRRLEVGNTYTLTIPEGVVCVAGDAEKLNPEIKVTYKGRPNAPVSAINISPADGIKIDKINASSNPVVVTFDAELSAVDSEDAGHMYLYLINDEGNREMISQLSGSIEGNAFAVYPIMEQRLAIGSTYEVVIEKNVVADISGADPNEEIVIRYEGSYIPGGDPRRPFEDDFDSGIDLTKWMLYDGDQLEPAETPAGWDFTAELPWWIARDSNESTDMAAVSHSMYNPAGKSDDWMVTNQIYLADETGVLSFKSQGYKKGVEDHLKVYIYECEDVYTALTPSIVDKIRYAEGALVYDEVQDPGANEETLAGDWTENIIPLDKYAGKYIYIAFVNDNRNKSAVFVDDVLVSCDVKYILSNLSSQSVVAADELTVKGLLTIESLTDTYTGYELNLVDAEGNVVSTLADPAMEMKNGVEMTFTFPETLKLSIGKVVNYGINVKLGDEISDNLSYSVKDLAVETTKRVVIEEYTGQACPNCPLGHAALDIIERDFGDKVIPLTIHTYPGDNFATPKASALQEFLGLNAAPTARVNRLAVSSPMEIVNDKYYYKDNGLWYDYVVSELSEYADADVDIISAVYEDDKYNVNIDVTYALDMDNRNVNIFAVIAEDGLRGVQSNNRATVDDPALGDWGKGGIYGSDPTIYDFNDVVRTYFGTTCNGTGGYIPANVVGGQAYNAEISIPNISRIVDPLNTSVTVMLIDATTGLVVNANRARISDPSGVEGVVADGSLNAYVENGNVVVRANALTLVDVYAIDGTRLASKAGEGEFTVDVNGYKGVALVTLRNGNVSKTVKVFVK